MSSLDIEFTLSSDTKEWLRVVAGKSKLHPSYFRILLVLREMNTSASVISKLTGIGDARVRQRLKGLHEYGYIISVENLSDKTKIWGLVEAMRRPDAPSYPTEAIVQARRRRQSEQWVNEYNPDLTQIWGGPDGVVRPRNPAKVSHIDASTLKQYEARTNK